MLRSVLRYPGGKSRGVDILLQYIPKNIRKMCSPFFGGGSLEITCSNMGMQIFGL